MHLRYALAIEETGSVTRAAEKLFIAQPNISRAIRELEGTVGVALFRRTPFGMVATEEGKPFLNHARHIVQEIDALKNTYENSQSGPFFSVCSHGGRYIAEAFASFAGAERTDFFLYTYQETDSENVISRVIQGLCKMGIIRFLARDAEYIRHYLTAHEINMELLFEAPLLYTISEGSPLASKKMISEEDVRNLTEITNGTIYTREPEKNARRQMRVFDRETGVLTLRKVEDAYILSTKEDVSYLNACGLTQKQASGDMVTVQDAVISPKKYVRTKQDKLFLDFLSEKVKYQK